MNEHKLTEKPTQKILNCSLKGILNLSSVHARKKGAVRWTEKYTILAEKGSHFADKTYNLAKHHFNIKKLLFASVTLLVKKNFWFKKYYLTFS